MRGLVKKRTYIIIGILCFIFMIYTVLQRQNILTIIFKYIFDVNYRTDFAPDRVIEGVMTIPRMIIFVIKDSYWSFDEAIVDGTFLFQLIIPFLGVIGGIMFYRKHTSIATYEFYRVNDYRKTILQDILLVSAKIACSIFIGYVAYLTFVNFLIGKNPHISGERDFLVDIFGKSFYSNSIYIYFLIEGWFRFFLVPFVYAVLSSSICLIAKSEKQVIFYPCLYYFGLSALGFGLTYIIGIYAIYFNPTIIMASGDYIDINSLLLIFIACIPLIIGLTIIVRETKHVEI